MKLIIYSQITPHKRLVSLVIIDIPYCIIKMHRNAMWRCIILAIWAISLYPDTVNIGTTMEQVIVFIGLIYLFWIVFYI